MTEPCADFADGPDRCTHGVLWVFYCAECDIRGYEEPELRATDPRRDHADSVGLPLHEKL